MVKETLERLGDKYELILVAAKHYKDVKIEETRDNYRIVRVGFGNIKIDKFLYPFLGALEAKKQKPEMAHAIMESYAGGALVVLKRIAPGIKRLLTLQSGDLDDDKKQKVVYVRYFWKLIHMAPNYITAISGFLAKRAIRLRACKDNVEVIPNGVDLSIVPQSIVKTPFQIFNHSRFSWEKAHDLIIEAWPKVVEKYSEAKLILVNDGPEKEKIVQLVKKKGLEDSVIMKGLMPQKDAFKLLAQSEIFICPSLAEGLGNVFIEAQAAGVVPVGTRVGGIPDVIQDMENGLLIDSKNSEQIAEAIIKLLDDKALRNKLRSKGLETSKLFEWGVVMSRIENVYNDILK